MIDERKSVKSVLSERHDDDDDDDDENQPTNLFVIVLPYVCPCFLCVLMHLLVDISIFLCTSVYLRT